MTYALFQVPAGYLVDRWDLRWSYAAAVAWWSLAADGDCHRAEPGMADRLPRPLGVGESFNWPCALRVTARVLPPAGSEPRKRHLQLGRRRRRGADADRRDASDAVSGLARDLCGHRRARFHLGRRLALSGTRPAQRNARRGERRQRPTEPTAARMWTSLSISARIGFAAVAAAAIGLAVSALWYGQSAVWLGIAIAMLGPLAVAAFLRGTISQASDGRRACTTLSG